MGTSVKTADLESCRSGDELGVKVTIDTYNFGQDPYAKGNAPRTVNFDTDSYDQKSDNKKENAPRAVNYDTDIHYAI